LLERGVLERREQYKDGRQLTSSYRLIGHNTECYRSSDVTGKYVPETPIADLTALEENDETRGASLAEAAENDVSWSAKSAGYAENCAPAAPRRESSKLPGVHFCQNRARMDVPGISHTLRQYRYRQVVHGGMPAQEILEKQD
jgi:hypothetical protein